MEGKFEVTLDGQTVGTVAVKQEGLYCRVSCRCHVPEGEIHRLYAGGEKIGVLVPEGDMLALETKVAAKRLISGCAFTLDGNREKFIPICPGETFPRLDRLRGGRLVFRDGRPGLMVQ